MSAVDPVTVIAVFQQVHVHKTLYIRKFFKNFKKYSMISLVENNSDLKTGESVFGESILNDGVAVVLFQVFKELISMIKDFGDMSAPKTRIVGGLTDVNPQNPP